jgi:hypothetical protein
LDNAIGTQVEGQVIAAPTVYSAIAGAAAVAGSSAVRGMNDQTRNVVIGAVTSGVTNYVLYNGIPAVYNSVTDGARAIRDSIHNLYASYGSPAPVTTDDVKAAPATATGEVGQAAAAVPPQSVPESLGSPNLNQNPPAEEKVLPASGAETPPDEPPVKFTVMDVEEPQKPSSSSWWKFVAAAIGLISLYLLIGGAAAFNALVSVLSGITGALAAMWANLLKCLSDR